MNPLNPEHALRDLTRRHFFSRCSMGVGSLALASLMSGKSPGATPGPRMGNPMQTKPTHFPAKAKNVIFLFMAGGPSQLDMFEHKPLLTKLNGKPIPESYTAGKRFAFMDSSHRSDLLGSRRSFKQYGQSGKWVSDLLPYTAGIIDDITLVTTCKTDLFNHAPAKLFMNAGSGLFGRPSMGAWVTYGLGSECDDLPGFVVLQSGPRGPRGGAVLWGSGILPTTYQGVPLRSQGDPIVNLSTPRSISQGQQRQLVDAVRELNLKRLVETGDDEISTRINAYEMAYRMQMSVPELTDLSQESAATLEAYGPEVRKPGSYAANCLLARRLLERDVRFVQLFHRGWDQHIAISRQLPNQCRDIDQPTAALLKDLKQSGLLEDTLVVFATEFGRTVFSQGKLGDPGMGRDHHGRAFTVWMAGGGIKPGIDYGATDDFCYNIVQDPVHLRDLHATILHTLGIDHGRFSHKFRGLNTRLTGVEEAHVVKKILT